MKGCALGWRRKGIPSKCRLPRCFGPLVSASGRANTFPTRHGKITGEDLQCLADDDLGIDAIRIIAECKSNSNPWIVFTSPHALNDFSRFSAFASLSDTARNALVDLNSAAYDNTDRKAILEHLFASYGKLPGKGELCEQLDTRAGSVLGLP
jgi:hypothetical protein